MSNYYGSGGYSAPTGGDAGGNTAYYNYGQQPPNQQEQQQNQQQQPQQQQQQPYGGSPTYANPNQWQAPQQQSTGMQPQQQNNQPSFWNPSTAATVAAMAGSMAQNGMSNPDAMLNFASTAGASFLQNSSARMIPGLEATMKNVRGYFAVDNRYVKSKMGRILFPFMTKTWTRMGTAPPVPLDMQLNGTPPGDVPGYYLPHSDDNAPDLYIPMMSFITYVLLCAMVYGNAGKFSPEVLTDVALWCFVFQVLEVIGIRFGFYTMQASINILDLFSYTGYKYLGLCVNMLAGIVLSHFGIGTAGYYVFFLYTASAASFFMLKTMANNIPLETRQGGPKRELMVVGFAASQFATMYFVSKTKFLS